MKLYSVTYRNGKLFTELSTCGRLEINANNRPQAMTGAQSMMDGEGWSVTVTEAVKIDDRPSTHAPTAEVTK